jgi:uncharacterized protein YidB (DUF937 family)
MGLLDQVLGGVLGQMNADSAPRGTNAAGMAGGGALLAMAMQFISSYPGGLPALLAKLSGSGYGQQADSWVGKGENQPISPDVLSQIFGQSQIGGVGRQFGVDESTAAGGLAALLPELVNQLTPQGHVEPQVQQATGDELGALLDGLRRNFG